MYLEVLLDDGTFANDITVNGKNVCVEDSEGGLQEYNITDNVTVNEFRCVDAADLTLSEIVHLYGSRKTFIAIDGEQGATLQQFGDDCWKDDGMDFDVADLGSIAGLTIGIKVGKEKVLSFKQILKKLADNG